MYLRIASASQRGEGGSVSTREESALELAQCHQPGPRQVALSVHSVHIDTIPVRTPQSHSGKRDEGAERSRKTGFDGDWSRRWPCPCDSSGLHARFVLDDSRVDGACSVFVDHPPSESRHIIDEIERDHRGAWICRVHSIDAQAFHGWQEYHHHRPEKGLVEVIVHQADHE